MAKNLGKITIQEWLTRPDLERLQRQLFRAKQVREAGGDGWLLPRGPRVN